jgi:hypothetical protein
MPVSFQTRSLTRLRYPTTTDGGTTVPNYSGSPASLTIAGWWIEPTTSIENKDARLAVQTGYTAVGPIDADILSTDHVSVYGVEYEVDGDVMRVPSPTGRLDSCRLSLIRWEG